jgi:hypothetical protein
MGNTLNILRHATESVRERKPYSNLRNVPKAKATEESPVQAGWKNQF